MTQDTAQKAVNGNTLNKCCNAGLFHFLFPSRVNLKGHIYAIEVPEKHIHLLLINILRLTAYRYAEIITLLFAFRQTGNHV